jgi:hypothetical protein
MSNRSIKKLCKLADEMNALSVSAKQMSSSEQIESGLSDEGARLYEEILKECAELARPEAMTTNQTIDGVPRELLERAISATMVARGPGSPTERDLRALLDAKPDGTLTDEGTIPAAQPQSEPVAIVIEQTHNYGHFLVFGSSIPGVQQPVPVTERKAHLLDQSLPTGTKLYAEQPAPVAVLPVRLTDDYGESNQVIYAGGWNACLDELKRLNTKE